MGGGKISLSHSAECIIGGQFVVGSGEGVTSWMKERDLSVPLCKIFIAKFSVRVMPQKTGKLTTSTFMGAVVKICCKKFSRYIIIIYTWMYFSSPCFLSRRAVGSRSLLVNGSLETTLAKPCFSGRSKPTERSMGRRRRERARVERLERERGEVKR